MSAQLPLAEWAPSDPDAQPAREPRQPRAPDRPRRSRRERQHDQDAADARELVRRRPLTKEELDARNLREHEAILRRAYGPFGVEPPKVGDAADRARADQQVEAVRARWAAEDEARGGGTRIYGTFMTWPEFEAEFQRREGRKPGDPLTAEQRRALRWPTR